jgi:hypothetical protein
MDGASLPKEIYVGTYVPVGSSACDKTGYKRDQKTGRHRKFTRGTRPSTTALKYPTPAIGGLFYGVASGSVLGRASNARSENKNL